MFLSQFRKAESFSVRKLSVWIPNDSGMLLARVSNLVTNVNVSKALQPSEEDSGTQVSETEVPVSVAQKLGRPTGFSTTGGLFRSAHHPKFSQIYPNFTNQY
jgi:hypothetical protein